MVIKMLKEIEELIEQKVLERTNALNSKILKLTEELQLFNAMMEEILDSWNSWKYDIQEDRKSVV